jgi:hypothetical protein
MLPILTTPLAKTAGQNNAGTEPVDDPGGFLAALVAALAPAQLPAPSPALPANSAEAPSVISAAISIGSTQMRLPLIAGEPMSAASDLPVENMGSAPQDADAKSASAFLRAKSDGAAGAKPERLSARASANDAAATADIPLAAEPTSTPTHEGPSLAALATAQMTDTSAPAADESASIVDTNPLQPTQPSERSAPLMQGDSPTGVGPNSSPRAALPAVTLPHLAARLVEAVRLEQDQLHLELAPADLGRVEVALHVDEQGQLHAAFAVERPETLQLLQRDARELAQSLTGNGLQLAQSGLSFDLRREGGRQDAAPAPRPTSGRTGGADPPEAGIANRRSARSQLLDLSV